WVGMVLSILVFGLGFSILYLLLFNLPTRQSVHDLATGAFVVKAPASVPLPAPLRHVHKVVIAVAVALSLVLPLGGLWLASRITSLAPLVRAGRTLDAQSHVVAASVNEGTSWSSFNGRAMHKTTMLNASVVMRRWPADPKATADAFASTLFQDIPDAGTRDVVSVQLVYGYDIGIARAWRSTNYSDTPAAWMRLESPRTTIH
ncbi:RDD domain containing protein, partial [mine drainage metagenome]